MSWGSYEEWKKQQGSGSSPSNGGVSSGSGWGSYDAWKNQNSGSTTTQNNGQQNNNFSNDQTYSGSRMGEFTSWQDTALSQPQGYTFTSINDLNSVNNGIVNYVNSFDYSRDNHDLYRSQINSGLSWIDNQMSQLSANSNAYKELKRWRETYSDLMGSLDRTSTILDYYDYMGDSDDVASLTYYDKDYRTSFQTSLEDKIVALEKEMEAMSDKSSAAYKRLMNSHDIYVNYLYANVLQRNAFYESFADVNDFTNWQRSSDYNNTIQLRNQIEQAQAELYQLTGVDPNAAQESAVDDSFVNKAPTWIHAGAGILKGLSESPLISGVGGFKKAYNVGKELIERIRDPETKKRARELETNIAEWQKDLSALESWQQRTIASAEGNAFDVNTDYGKKISDVEALLAKTTDNVDRAKLEAQISYFEGCAEKQKLINTDADALDAEIKELQKTINSNVFKGNAAANPELYREIEEKQALSNAARVTQEAYRGAQLYKTETLSLNGSLDDAIANDELIQSGQAFLNEAEKKTDTGLWAKKLLMFNGIDTLQAMVGLDGINLKLGGERRMLGSFLSLAMTAKEDDGWFKNFSAAFPNYTLAGKDLTKLLTDQEKATVYRLLGQASKTGSEADIQKAMDYCSFLNEKIASDTAEDFQDMVEGWSPLGRWLMNNVATPLDHGLINGTFGGVSFVEPLVANWTKDTSVGDMWSDKAKSVTTHFGQLDQRQQQAMLSATQHDAEFQRWAEESLGMDRGGLDYVFTNFAGSGTSLSSVVNEGVDTIATMLPGILLGNAVGEIFAGAEVAKTGVDAAQAAKAAKMSQEAAKLFSVSLLGGSAAGSAYRTAKQQGFNENKALWYGGATGLSEALSEYWVESIAGRVGISEGALQDSIANMANAKAQFWATMGVRTFGEALEEYASNKVEYVLNDLILNKYDRFSVFDKEDWHTVLAAVFSTGALEFGGSIGGGGAKGSTIGLANTGALYAQKGIASKNINALQQQIRDAGKALNSSASAKEALLLLTAELSDVSDGTMTKEQLMAVADAKELAEKLKSGKAKATDTNIGKLLQLYMQASGSTDIALTKLTNGALAVNEIDKRKAANTAAAENLEAVKANPDAHVLNTLQTQIRAIDGTLSESKAEAAADIINTVIAGKALSEEQMKAAAGNTQVGKAVRLWMSQHGATELRANMSEAEASSVIKKYTDNVRFINEQQDMLRQMSVVRQAEEAAKRGVVRNAVDANSIQPPRALAVNAAQAQATAAQQAVTEAKGMTVDQLAEAARTPEQQAAYERGQTERKIVQLRDEAAAIDAQIKKLRGKKGSVPSAKIAEQIKQLEQKRNAKLIEIAKTLSEAAKKNPVPAKSSKKSKASSKDSYTIPGSGRVITREEFVQDQMANGVSEEQANKNFDETKAQADAINGTEGNSNGRNESSNNTSGRDSDVGNGRQTSGRNKAGGKTGPLGTTRTVSIGNVQAEVEDTATITKLGDVSDELLDAYPELRDVLDAVKKDGFANVAFVNNGRLAYRNGEGKLTPAEAMYNNGTLLVGLDNPQKSVVGTINHERFHHFVQTRKKSIGAKETNKFVRGILQHLLSETEYIDAFRKYCYGVGYGGYSNIYSGKEGLELIDLINEEIACDIIGGINNFNLSLGDLRDQALDFLEEAEANLEVFGFETVGRTVHSVEEGTLLDDTDVGNPSSDIVNVGDTTKLAYYGLMNALGFNVDTDAKKKEVYRDGERVTEVTVDDIKNSPVGALIDYAFEQGFIDSTQAEQEYKLFASIGTLANQVNDFSMAMQFMGSTIFTAMKANSDKQYGTTYDFPSICTKTQAVIDDMSAQMVKLGRALTEDEIIEIYNRQFNAGNPVTCPECYVFTRWVGIGGLLDNIKYYQDTFGGMSFDEIEAEYQKAESLVLATMDEMNIRKGQAKGKAAKQLEEKISKLEEKIQKAENSGQNISKKDVDQYEKLSRQRTTIRAMTWIDEVYFGGKEHSDKNINPNFRVPNKVLYDLNNGEEFAKNYKEAWAFRTTQGAGYGKAITPYAEAILGEGILVTNNTTQAIKAKAAGNLKNDFLTEKGKITAKSNRGKKLTTARKKQLNQLFIGGQRLQSTSDARFDNATDYLLAGLELQSMQAGAQVYTKVPGAVHFFDVLGYCTNMSLMPKGGGLDANGVPIDTTVGGMNPETAMTLRLGNEHAGTITIGVNDAHIRAMFQQAFRDFIIPYHASGGRKSLISKMRKTQENDANFEAPDSSDYTKTQSDRILGDDLLSRLGKSEKEIEDIHRFRDTRLYILSGGKVGTMHREMLDTSAAGLTSAQQNARKILQELYVSFQPGGKWYDSDLKVGVQLAKSKVEHQIFPNEFWDTKSTYETSGVNTQRYLDYCDALGFLHRFSGKTIGREKVVLENGDVVYRQKIVTVNGYNEKGEKVPLTDLAYKNGTDASGGIEDFFWKTLTDRRMYGNNGQYLEQPTVSLARANAGDVTTFAAPMGERRYSRSKALSVAAKPLSSTNETRLSLQNLDYEVEPTSNAWQRDHTTAEVKEQFPDLWDITADESEVRNPTQVKDTVKTYRKIYDILKAEGFDGKILDASSGLGYGTQAGIEEYGFDVEDIEPYPDKSYTPKYTDYDSLNETYDAIISNAVLNVLPQDQRDALVVKMGEMLNPGGRIFINVRGDDVRGNKSNQPIGGKWEYYVANTGSYQKGFTKPELKAYLQDALGPGFDVKITDKFGKTSAIVTKTGETKLSLQPGEENAISIPDTTVEETGETVDFINNILDGEKWGETRTHTKLTRNQWLGIAKDGKVYGRVKLGDPIKLQKNTPEYEHSFIKGTKYDIDAQAKNGKTVYYYPILEREDFRDNPIPVGRNGSLYSQYRPGETKFSIQQTGTPIDEITQLDFVQNYAAASKNKSLGLSPAQMWMADERKARDIIDLTRDFFKNRNYGKIPLPDVKRFDNGQVFDFLDEFFQKMSINPAAYYKEFSSNVKNADAFIKGIANILNKTPVAEFSENYDIRGEFEPTETDLEYLDAVKTNNVYVLAKIISDAAAKAGYKSFYDLEQPDENGVTRAKKGAKFYQHSWGKRLFDAFAKGEFGFHIGSESQAASIAVYSNGQTDILLPLYAKITNPIKFVDMVSDYLSWSPRNMSQFILDVWNGKINKSKYPEMSAADWAKLNELKPSRRTIEMLARDSRADDDSYDSPYRKQFSAMLESYDFDAIEYWNRGENTDKGGTAYLIWDPSQIKSADLITYSTQDKKIIAPSQRFNENEERYRYSVQTLQDANIIPAKQNIEGSQYMYSTLDRVVDQKIGGKANIDQLISQFTNKNVMSNWGVKQDEINTRGLIPWLEQQKAEGKTKITKEELKQFLAENPGQMEEHIRDNRKYEGPEGEVPEELQNAVKEAATRLADTAENLRRKLSEKITPEQLSQIDMYEFSSKSESAIRYLLADLFYKEESDKAKETLKATGDKILYGYKEKSDRGEIPYGVYVHIANTLSRITGVGHVIYTEEPGVVSEESRRYQERVLTDEGLTEEDAIKFVKAWADYSEKTNLYYDARNNPHLLDDYYEKVGEILQAAEAHDAASEDFSRYRVEEESARRSAEWKHKEKYDTKWGDYSFNGGIPGTYEERYYKDPNGPNYKARGERRYRHNADSDVVVHARTQQFHDAEGNTVLHVDEIQSDWHNEGGSEGYQISWDESEAANSEIRSLKEDIGFNLRLLDEARKEEEAPAQTDILAVKSGDGSLEQTRLTRADLAEWDEYGLGADEATITKLVEDDILFGSGQVTGVSEVGVWPTSEVRVTYRDYDTNRPGKLTLTWTSNSENTAQLLKNVIDAENEVRSLNAKQKASTPHGPYEGTAYITYAAKQLLSEAIDKDLSRITWTTPEQQAQRWSREFIGAYERVYDSLGQALDKIAKQLKVPIKKGETIIGSKVGIRNALKYHSGIDEAIEYLRSEYNDDLTTGDTDPYGYPREPVGFDSDDVHIVPYFEITPELKKAVQEKGMPRFSVQSENTDEDIIEAAGDMRKAADLFPEESLEHELLNIMASNDADSIMEWVNEKMSDYLRGKPQGEKPSGFIPKMTEQRLKTINNGIDKLINQYGALEEGDQRKNAKPFPLPAKTKANNKMRKHVGTVGESTTVAEPMKPYVKEFSLTNVAATYVPESDKKHIQSAVNTLERMGLERALHKFEVLADATAIPTADAVALGEQLLIETAANGDTGNFLKVLAATCEMSSQIGKSLQAFSLLKKSGPIGQLYYVQKAVDRMNQKTYAKRIQSGKMAPILINDADVKAVLTAATEKDRDDAMKVLLQKVADQVPATLADRWNAWRYLSMLGNPRTHIRNIVGNALFTPLIFTKNMLASGGEFIAEKLGVMDESQRTKDLATTLHIDNTYRQFAKDDAVAMQKELQGNGKYNPANEIMQMRKVLPGFLDKGSKWNSELLEKEDWLFLRKAYVAALSQALANSGYTVEQLQTTQEGMRALNEARAVAVQEAQRATYRDFSQTAAALNRFKQIDSGLGKVGALALEGVVPFTKTPLNILKRGIEYSPVGLAMSLANVAKDVATGNYTNAAQVIDRLCAGLTGTGIAILGALLSKLGWIRGKKDDDKEEQFDLLHGYQDYSLNIGDKSFTIDWAVPASLPLFTGVAAIQLLEGDDKLSGGDIWDAAMMIAEPMMSLSMLDGINKAINSASYADSNAKLMTVAKSAFSSYFGQAFPTILGQVARTLDPVRRTSYTDKNSKVNKDLQSFYQGNVASKIPGLEQTKPEYVDQWGRTQTNGGILRRALENFILPGYVKNIEVTPLDDELQRLYEATGNSSVLPASAFKDFTVGGEKKNLTAEEYVAAAKDMGQMNYRMLNDVVYDPRYTALNDEQKAKALEYFYKYTKNVAKWNLDNNYKMEAKWIGTAQAATSERARQDIIWQQVLAYIEKNMSD